VEGSVLNGLPRFFWTAPSLAGAVDSGFLGRPRFLVTSGSLFSLGSSSGFFKGRPRFLGDISCFSDRSMGGRP